MLSGEFERKLRRLNSNIRIFCGDDSSKAAGIYTVESGEYKSICGIDKNELPEYTIYALDGSIVKSGFRRAIKVLINQGYIDRFEAEKEFGLKFEYKAPKFKYSSPSLREKLMRKGIPVTEEANGNR
jgi:hypothetical protein